MNLHLAWTGLPYNVYRCAGGVGSSFVQGVHGSAVGGRIVFIPKSCAPYGNSRIVRSPEAVRRLTLCKCECKVFTIALCVGQRTPWSAFSSQRRLSQSRVKVRHRSDFARAYPSETADGSSVFFRKLASPLFCVTSSSTLTAKISHPWSMQIERVVPHELLRIRGELSAH